MLKRKLILVTAASFLFPSLLLAWPRYKNPQNPDQTYQNDLDLQTQVNRNAKRVSSASTGTYCDQLGANGNSTNGFECFINGILVFKVSGGDFEIFPDTSNPNAFIQGALSSGQPVLQGRPTGTPWQLGSSTFKWTSLYVSSGIVGTTTNDNAPTGYVGEYLSSVTVTNVIFPASNVYGDILSLTLTAGDWEITGEALASLNGATCTAWELGLSATSGNSTAGLTYGTNRFDSIIPTASASTVLSIPSFRVSLSATTTYNLKFRDTCSAGNLFTNANFHTRRMR